MIEITDTDELGLVVTDSDAVLECVIKALAVPNEALADAVDDFVIADVMLPSSETVELVLAVDDFVRNAEKVPLALCDARILAVSEKVIRPETEGDDDNDEDGVIVIVTRLDLL